MRRGSRRTRGQTDAWHAAVWLSSRGCSAPTEKRKIMQRSRRPLPAIWWRHLYICRRYWRESTSCAPPALAYLSTMLCRSSNVLAQVLGSLYENSTATCLWLCLLLDENSRRVYTMGFKGGSFWKSWEFTVLRTKPQRYGYDLRWTCSENFVHLWNSRCHAAQRFMTGRLFRSELGILLMGHPWKYILEILRVP